MSEPIRYDIDLSLHVHHLARVTLHVPADVSPGARIVLPAWTPGSYVIRDYVHHLQWIRAYDADGAELRLTPDGRTAWFLPDAARGPVRVELEVYGHELTVRTNHIDDHHALIIPPATLPMVEAARDREHRVRLQAPAGWETWGLLPEEDGTYVAEDFLHLVDSAFEAGTHPQTTWEVAAVPHRFVWTAHGGTPDLGRVAEDGRRIGEAAVALFDGDLPSPSYTFLCAGWDAGGGGLEHRDGSVLAMPVRTFQDDDRYRTFQSLMAHEYLHLWNVKRLTPEALVDPDFENPAHSPSLWVAEGWTSYYDELIPTRAGLWDVPTYLKKLAGRIDHRLDTVGRRYQSLREASHQAWTKFYVRDENSDNAGISYYSHGGLVAWMFDLLIRRARPDSDGLDEAFRLLWERFGNSDKGYREADVEAAVSEAAGTDLGEWFDRHVGGREDPPFEELVGAVGLALTTDAENGTPAWLGATTSDRNGHVALTSVVRDGPAWSAGITGGDTLVAIDGGTVAPGDLDKALRAYAPGDNVEVAVTRGPRLLTLSVTLGEARARARLVAQATATDTAIGAFERWTQRSFEDVPTNGAD